ncbi:MAG: hypothetical protein Q4G10_05845 [Bacteroidia bacterium]|nr:hypothetical protein [Bacteroidia bacterium]
MKEKISALYSEYVIDGIAQELTPDRMLAACLAEPSSEEKKGVYGQIVDESMDPALKPCVTDPSGIDDYADMVEKIPVRIFPSAFPETYTKSRIASALIDTIWRKGHFRLDDLMLRLDWKWNPRRIGDMADFYSSAYSAADYTDSLGVRLTGYSYEEVTGESALEVTAGIMEKTQEEDEEDLFDTLPFETAHPHLDEGLMHPSRFVPDPQSWIIYIPFENCEYRLGGSLLAQALGVSGAVAPQIVDADYFIDCYEVVRELVEDGVVIAGATVGDGGLMAALNAMAGAGTGASVELSDLAHTTGEKDIVRLLFSEVPGVLVQINDIDYDYVDAELLLQDVAFYPLGHPTAGSPDVTVQASGKSGIQTILESLISSQSSEGED